MSYAIVRVGRRSMDLDSFARATNLHPDLIRRLIALGLLETIDRGVDTACGWNCHCLCL